MAAALVCIVGGLAGLSPGLDPHMSCRGAAFGVIVDDTSGLDPHMSCRGAAFGVIVDDTSDCDDDTLIFIGLTFCGRAVVDGTPAESNPPMEKTETMLSFLTFLRCFSS